MHESISFKQNALWKMESICYEQGEIMMEETDLWARSNKKVKTNRGKCPMKEELMIKGLEDKVNKGCFSYKDSLLVSAFLEQQLMQDSQHEHYMSEKDESGEEDCPVIKLSMEEKKHIRAPWRQTIIVKVMGWWVGYAYLLRRLQSLWKIHRNLGLMDLGNDFFLAKFSNSDDRDFALF